MVRSVESTSRNAERIAEYALCGERTGPLTTPPDSPAPVVQYRRVTSRRDRIFICLLGALNVAIGLLFAGPLLVPRTDEGHGWRLLLSVVVVIAAVVVVFVGQLGALAVWLWAYIACDPVPWVPEPNQRVALVTTIVPSKEPLEMVEKTLVAMTKVEYDGQVDVWILDEGDDDAVKAVAERLGIHHFSRKGRPEYNQPEGQFRQKCKGGNHNSWLAEHGHRYELVAQMDSDHVPFPWMLERSLGYFRDPDIAFVAMPHVYGNRHDNWVTYGASGWMFSWNSVTLRGGNGLGTQILEGANHAYRTSALQLIGGYQDSLTEDRPAGMCMLGTTNPATGNPFTAVYTPDIMTVGEAPATWSDWFTQQKRWSCGVWQIYTTPKLRAGVSHHFKHFRTALGYILHDITKPVEFVWLALFTVLTVAHLLGATAAVGGWWVALGMSTVPPMNIVTMQLWLRRYNATEHERRRLGVRATALRVATMPIFFAAGVVAVLRRPPVYSCTAKNRFKSSDLISTFRLHLWWAALTGAALGCAVWTDRGPLSMRTALALVLITSLAAPLASGAARIGDRLGRSRRSRAPSPTRS